jgi:AcrR family transcriptional regulator
MQQRSLETRASILDAARDLFAQSGYDATGVAEICSAAGVSKGAFYHHFTNKQAVFLALLNDWLAGLDEQLAAFRGEDLPVPMKLVRMTAMIRDVIRMASTHLPIFLEFWLRAKREPEVWQATILPYHRYQEYFAELIQEGIVEGSLRAVDPQVASRMVVALAVGLLLQGLFDPNDSDWVQVTQGSMLILMEGLVKDISV